MTRLQRWRDRALLVPVATFVLLTPPVLQVFGIKATVFGVPLLFVYFFSVWALLIAIGGRVARRLSRLSDANDTSGSSGQGL